jgi:hypothetical protein
MSGIAARQHSSSLKEARSSRMSQHVLLYNPKASAELLLRTGWSSVRFRSRFTSHKMPIPNGTGKLRFDVTQHELSVLDSHHLRTITSARHCFFFSASAPRRRMCSPLHIHIQKALSNVDSPCIFNPPVVTLRLTPTFISTFSPSHSSSLARMPI